jgi:hypothetical protein
MISNNRQASVSRKRREELLHAAEEAPPNKRSSYLGLAEEIGRELEEYDAIRKGAINLFQIEDMDAIGEALVKARISRRNVDWRNFSTFQSRWFKKMRLGHTSTPDWRAYPKSPKFSATT